MSDFKYLRQLAGLGRNAAADLFGVTGRTVRNWDEGKQEPPRAVFLYLKVLGNDLGHLGPEWAGFRFRGGLIESPEGDFLYPHEVRAIRYLWQAAGLERHRMAPALKKRGQGQLNPEDCGNVTPLARRKPSAG